MENSGYDITHLEWANNWDGYLKWELLSQFEWNVSDVVDPLTKETTHLRINPYIDAYGYLYGTFKWSFNDDWFIMISGYVQPF